MRYENIYLQNNNQRGNITNKEEFKKLCKTYETLSRNIEEEYVNNIISFDEVRERKERMNKSLTKAVLEIHTAPITQGKGKDTRWFTPIKKGGKRVILKKPTYDEIIAELIDFYGIGKDKLTLRNLYPIWVQSMLDRGKSTTYIKRFHADWEKYYINDPIIDIEFKNLTINRIRDWLTLNISKHQLNSKQYYNMQTIFKQVVTYAFEEELIEKNPFDKIKIQRKVYFKGEQNKNQHTKQYKQEVFTEEDIHKIKLAAWEDYTSNPHFTTATASLGILLLFQTGLRVGELVALRERNIYEDHIFVEAEEQREYDIIIDNDKKTIRCNYLGTKVGKAKTDAAYRKIPLTTEAKRLIALIRKTNEENGFKTEDFLFVNKTQRMQENTILKRIYRYCDKVFIDRRSPHKVRKTFASLLVNNGIMDISEIASILGHTNEKTLIDHYLYSTKEPKTQLERMELSLAV